MADAADEEYQDDGNNVEDSEDDNDALVYCPMSSAERGAWKEQVRGMSLGTLLSPRVRSIIIQLQMIREEVPEEKIVVVSRFVRFLDVVQEAMHKTAVTTPVLAVGMVTYSGHINTDERVENLRIFNQLASGPIILFLSAAAGGTGLNIATASRLIICEPQFSPGADTQLIGRLHRLPQTRDVYVYRLVGRPCAIDTYLIDNAGRKSEFERGLMVSLRREDGEPLLSTPLE
jgi:SNF2 family DNA or RNA helicase